MNDSLKLSEFLEIIKSTIEVSFANDGFWVVAELSEWRKSGTHFYGELIEHDGKSRYPIAKIRCNCWANVANYINTKFNSSTGEPLRSDMKVLLKVSVKYHISFGLSLNIIDIDPAFTLGDRQARKTEILNNLTRLGIINNNKSLDLPTDFTRVAVITSLSAAGKGDFFEEADRLESLGLCSFDIYDAKMQGSECATSVTAAFDSIKNKADIYDVIVVIRGGGSQSDLDWFNNILPATSICNSKIPVFVGIGHERDNCVLDDICTKTFDTPSKVINYIVISILNNASDAKNDYISILQSTKSIVNTQKMYVDNIYSGFTSRLQYYINHLSSTADNNYSNAVSLSKSIIRFYNTNLQSNYSHIKQYSHNLINEYEEATYSLKTRVLDMANNITDKCRYTSDFTYKQILSLSIEPTLSRGFSVTQSIDGNYITTKLQALKHDKLNIVYSDGVIQTRIMKDGDTE